MRGIELPFGLHVDGRMVSVVEVQSGLDCRCVCPECGSRLVAKKGNQIAHHFAHEVDADCARAYETMLHKLGKQMILAAGGVTVPLLAVQYLEFERQVYPESWIAFDHVQKEVRWPGFQPDIVARRGRRELAVEIKVAHACGPEKIETVRASGLAMVEIDLSGLPRSAPEEEIREAVLRTAPRVWLFNPKLNGALSVLQQEVESEREAARRRENAEWQRYMHDIVRKMPDDGYRDIEVDGVTISSRYGHTAEIQLMAEALIRLEPRQRKSIVTFFCDSKATNNYIVTMHKGHDFPDLTAALGRSLHEQIMLLNGGHNGIHVGETAVIDPDWNESDRADPAA